MKKELPKKCRWFMYVKLVFYILIFANLLSINLISLFRMDQTGDYYFNEKPHPEMRILSITLLCLMSAWIVLMLISVVFTAINFKTLGKSDKVMFSLNLWAILMFLIALTFGSLSPRFTIGEITVFIYGFLNIYTIMGLLLHVPAVNETKKKKKTVKENDSV